MSPVWLLVPCCLLVFLAATGAVGFVVGALVMQLWESCERSEGESNVEERLPLPEPGLPPSSDAD